MSGGGGSVEYKQSPEARAAMNMFMPLLGKVAMAGMGSGTMGQNMGGWNPGMFQMPPGGGMSPYQMDQRGFAPSMMGGSGAYPADYGDAWGQYYGGWGRPGWGDGTFQDYSTWSGSVGATGNEGDYGYGSTGYDSGPYFY